MTRAVKQEKKEHESKKTFDPFIAPRAGNNSTLILMGDLSACGTHRQAGADQNKPRTKSQKKIRRQKRGQSQSPCWRAS